jgi:hypothetical protein
MQYLDCSVLHKRLAPQPPSIGTGRASGAARPVASRHVLNQPGPTLGGIGRPAGADEHALPLRNTQSEKIRERDIPGPPSGQGSLGQGLRVSKSPMKPLISLPAVGPDSPMERLIVGHGNLCPS